MSVAWLIREGSKLPDIGVGTGIRFVPIESGKREAASCQLSGYEILITDEVAIDAALLKRCRWLRGIVGLGPRAGEIVDWPLVERRGLLAAIVEPESERTVELERLTEILAVMERRLRRLDDIADTWEGT